MSRVKVFVFITYLWVTCIASKELQRCSNEVNSSVAIPKEFIFSDDQEVNFRIGDTVHLDWCQNGVKQNFTMSIPRIINTKKLSPEEIPALPKGQVHHKLNLTSDAPLSTINVAVIKFAVEGQVKIGQEIYSTNDYCISKNEDNVIEIMTCKHGCSGAQNGSPCLKKCCKTGSMVNYSEQRCSPVNHTSEDWIPRMYTSPYSSEVEDMRLRHISPSYTISPPKCQPVILEDGTEEPGPFLLFPSFELPAEETIPWKISGDGQIWWKKPNRGWTKLATDNYCVDAVGNFGQETALQEIESDQQVLILCSDEAPKSVHRYSILYVTVMFISAVFLFITAVVYVALWSFQNVHGWTIFSHVTSMFFMYISLASAHLFGITHTSDEGGGTCRFIGVTAHFFFLSTFCWLGVINFDLCYTFRTLNPSGAGKSKGLKRYWCYFLFAVSIPTSVIAVGLILEHIYWNDTDSDVILPRYGVALCYVAVSAQGVYVYSIVGTLLGVNLVLILITTTTIFRLKKSTKSVIKNSTASTNQSYWLFLKLFIVMGVTWVFEIISWAEANGSDDTEIQWYWVFFDVVNILQAVAIFFIFVCKKRILNQLKTKYPRVTSSIEDVFRGAICRKLKSPTNDHEIEIPTAHTSVANNSKESAETPIP